MTMAQQRPLRHVIIGVGAGVFAMHRPALSLPTVQIVGVSDINIPLGQQRAELLSCDFFPDYQQMLTQTQPEVAVIMTPHPFHAQIALDCLNAGCHVLVEKPLAIQVAEADLMIETAKSRGRLLGVIFQQRFRPEVQAAYSYLQAGRLGELQRVELTAIWPRPQSYFRQAPWRGTWKGEGGGVLMNQGIHNLDLLCYLVGLPTRLSAWTRTSLHQIETEDTAHAMLTWENGALGSLHISTAEADLPERLKIVGSRGSLVLQQNSLEISELESDLKEYIATCQDPFAAPRAHSITVELPESRGNHETVYRHFQQAILENKPFTTEGIYGRMSLELANAIIYSSQTQAPVDLPLDRLHYTALLINLRSGM